MTITELYEDAREWIKDALISDSSDYFQADELDRAEIRSCIDDNWDGGWSDFVRTSEGV